MRLLALTGARRTKALAMEWSEVDLEKGIWTRKPERNKNPEAFTAPLDPDVITILKAIRARRDAGPKWAKV